MIEQRRSWLSIVLAAIGGAVLALGVHAGPLSPHRAPQATVADIKPLIISKFVREIDPVELEHWALRGMISGLQDPYSSFMTPEEAREFRESTDNEFGGLGMQIVVRDGLIEVVVPLEETPAFEAGLVPGTRIIEIDGQPREFRSAAEAARVLKGEPGTEIGLTVLHPGATRPVEVTLTRAIIRVRSVRPPVMEDPDALIGYLRVTQFSPQTADEVRQAVEELEAMGARGLILDLRFNPGGYLEVALEIADLFIAEGIILQTRGRADERIYEAKAEGTLPPRPMAVLINGGSASAAEILAGALSDAGLASTVGARTYGKGAVQQISRLSDGSAVRLTTHHFHTRSGRRIHREETDEDEGEWGILPDLEVALADTDLQQILLRRRTDAFQDADAPGPETDPDAAPLIDTQLEAALEHLRAELRRR